MSLTLKIFLILSFLNISHSSILLKQTKFSNDFFYDKEYQDQARGLEAEVVLNAGEMEQACGTGKNKKKNG